MNRKRFLAILLSLVMLLGMLPAASAEETEMVTVTYDYTGSPFSISVEKGSTLILPGPHNSTEWEEHNKKLTDALNDGQQHFVGDWGVENNWTGLSARIVADQDLTITPEAHTKSGDTYTISFHNGDDEPAEWTLYDEDGYTYVAGPTPEMLSFTAPAEGAQFQYWTTAAGSAWNANNSSTINSADDWYAVWDTTVTITVVPVEGEEQPISVQAGVMNDLDSYINTNVTDGKAQSGWYVDADNSGDYTEGETVYLRGEKVAAYKDITLRSMMEDVLTITIIKLDGTEIELNGVSDAPIVNGSKVPLAEYVTTGLTESGEFQSGWYVDADNSSNYTEGETIYAYNGEHTATGPATIRAYVEMPLIVTVYKADGTVVTLNQEYEGAETYLQAGDTVSLYEYFSDAMTEDGKFQSGWYIDANNDGEYTEGETVYSGQSNEVTVNEDIVVRAMMEQALCVTLIKADGSEEKLYQNENNEYLVPGTAINLYNTVSTETVNDQIQSGWYMDKNGNQSCDAGEEYYLLSVENEIIVTENITLHAIMETPITITFEETVGETEYTAEKKGVANADIEIGSPEEVFGESYSNDTGLIFTGWKDENDKFYPWEEYVTGYYSFSNDTTLVPIYEEAQSDKPSAYISDEQVLIEPTGYESFNVEYTNVTHALWQYSTDGVNWTNVHDNIEKKYRNSFYVYGGPTDSSGTEYAFSPDSGIDIIKNDDKMRYYRALVWNYTGATDDDVPTMDTSYAVSNVVTAYVNPNESNWNSSVNASVTVNDTGYTEQEFTVSGAGSYFEYNGIYYYAEENTFRWFRSKDEGATWEEIEDANGGSTITETPTETGTLTYRFIANYVYDGVTGTLTATSAPVTIYDGIKIINNLSNEPVSLTVGTGKTHTMTVDAENADSYQWYRYDTDGTRTLLNGEFRNSYTFTAGNTPEEVAFYCVLKNSESGQTVETNFAWIYVQEPQDCSVQYIDHYNQLTEAEASTVVKEGEEITLPTLTDMEHRRFLGWTANSDTDLLEGGSKYTIDTTTLFYAQWQEMGDLILRLATNEAAPAGDAFDVTVSLYTLGEDGETRVPHEGEYTLKDSEETVTFDQEGKASLTLTTGSGDIEIQNLPKDIYFEITAAISEANVHAQYYTFGFYEDNDYIVYPYGNYIYETGEYSVEVQVKYYREFRFSYTAGEGIAVNHELTGGTVNTDSPQFYTPNYNTVSDAYDMDSTKVGIQNEDGQTMKGWRKQGEENTFYIINGLVDNITRDTVLEAVWEDTPTTYSYTVKPGYYMENDEQVWLEGTTYEIATGLTVGESVDIEAYINEHGLYATGFYPPPENMAIADWDVAVYIDGEVVYTGSSYTQLENGILIPSGAQITGDTVAYPKYTRYIDFTLDYGVEGIDSVQIENFPDEGLWREDKYWSNKVVNGKVHAGWYMDLNNNGSFDDEGERLGYDRFAEDHAYGAFIYKSNMDQCSNTVKAIWVDGYGVTYTDTIDEQEYSATVVYPATQDSFTLPSDAKEILDGVAGWNRDGFVFDCWTDSEGNKVDEAELENPEHSNISFMASWEEANYALSLTDGETTYTGTADTNVITVYAGEEAPDLTAGHDGDLPASDDGTSYGYIWAFTPYEEGEAKTDYGWSEKGDSYNIGDLKDYSYSEWQISVNTYDTTVAEGEPDKLNEDGTVTVRVVFSDETDPNAPFYLFINNDEENNIIDYKGTGNSVTEVGNPYFYHSYSGTMPDADLSTEEVEMYTPRWEAIALDENGNPVEDISFEVTSTNPESWSGTDGATDGGYISKDTFDDAAKNAQESASADYSVYTKWRLVLTMVYNDIVYTGEGDRVELDINWTVPAAENTYTASIVATDANGNVLTNYAGMMSEESVTFTPVVDPAYNGTISWEWDLVSNNGYDNGRDENGNLTGDETEILASITLENLKSRNANADGWTMTAYGTMDNGSTVQTSLSIGASYEAPEEPEEPDETSGVKFFVNGTEYAHGEEVTVAPNTSVTVKAEGFGDASGYSISYTVDDEDVAPNASGELILSYEETGEHTIRATASEPVGVFSMDNGDGTFTGSITLKIEESSSDDPVNGNGVLVDPTQENSESNPNPKEIDVTGILKSNEEVNEPAKYGIELHWGAMAFQYSYTTTTTREWDAENHAWTDMSTTDSTGTWKLLNDGALPLADDANAIFPNADQSYVVVFNHSNVPLNVGMENTAAETTYNVTTALKTVESGVTATSVSDTTHTYTLARGIEGDFYNEATGAAAKIELSGTPDKDISANVESPSAVAHLTVTFSKVD